MKFKKFRYNLIVMGLIAIVSCCVALPLVTGGKNDINQGTIIEDPASKIEDPIEDPNVDVEDETEEPNYEEDKFLYYKSVDLINYAVDLLYNGKGFNSSYNQVIMNTTSVAGANITVPQNSKGFIKRAGKDSIQENYFWSPWTGIGSDQIKNYYQYYYIDKTNNTLTDARTTDYDKDNCTHGSVSAEKMSYEEGIAKYLQFFGDSFPVKTNTKRGDTIYSDKIVESKTTKYREIKVVYNVAYVSNVMKDFYSSTGQLTDINYTSLTMTYKINVSTGKMISITRVEKMTGSNPQTGFGVSSVATTTQNFSSVDKEQTIVLP